MEQEAKNEILEAIHLFSDAVDKRFEKIEHRLDGMDGRLEGMDGRLNGVEGHLEGVDSRLNRVETQLSQIKSTMVTKDYLDEKLGDLRGDLVVLTRKEDKKVVAILELLVERQVIDRADAKRILAMEPFPQLAL